MYYFFIRGRKEIKAFFGNREQSGTISLEVQRIKTTFKFWIKIYVLSEFYFRPHRVPGTRDLAYPRTSEKSRHYYKLLGHNLTNLFESWKWFWWQIRFSDPIRPSLFLHRHWRKTSTRWRRRGETRQWPTSLSSAPGFLTWRNTSTCATEASR